MSTRDRSAHWVEAAACAAVGAWIFQSWGNATHGYIATNSLFYWWGFQWVNPDSETQHAWLVLALALFAFWRNLRRLPPQDRPQAGSAGCALVGALALHAAGYVAQQPRVSIVALLLYAWGCLVLGGGSRFGRAGAFPAGFMVFAVPVNALDTVSFWLRMGVVKAGAWIAHACGVGVLRSGTQLLAPDGRYQYDVVAACSGVRSLMALAALALFIGYLWFRPVWLRAAMLLLCGPLVFAGNVLRLVTIIFAAQLGGQAWGDRAHAVMGFAVFAVVLGGLIAAAEGVDRLRPRWGEQEPPRPGPAPVPAAGAVPAAAVAAVVVALAVGEAAFLAHRAAQPPLERAGVRLAADGLNPAELPTFVGADWMGHRVEPSAVERSILPPDTGFSRKLYVNLEAPEVQVLLSIVLSGRDRTSIHRPELCLVGQGWSIDSSQVHHFDDPAGTSGGWDATLLHVRREGGVGGQKPQPALVAYWFVGGDRVVASQGARMLFDAWNRLAHGRADRWAYVLLQTRSDDGDDAAIGRMRAVLEATKPAFQPGP